MGIYNMNFPKSTPWRNERVKEGESEKAIYNVHSLLADLKSCSTRGDLQWGRKLHAKAVEIRHYSNKHVLTALIRMYAKCHSMVDARCVFDSIQKPDVVSWTALLLGYAKNGNGFATLEFFSKMKVCGCTPDSVTYIAVLKACTSLAEDDRGECLKRGREIHSQIDCDLTIFLQNTIMDMYAKCGSMIEARSVFDSIQKPSVVSWNALLLGYVQNGEGLTTLELFSWMKSPHGCVPDSVTYVAALKACTYLAVNGEPSRKGDWLERGKRVHLEIGLHLNLYVQNTLVGMYSKCGSMVDARSVFQSIQKPDVVSWTALLLGYAENGDGLATLELFSRMKASGCKPDSVTYIAALKACTSLAGNQLQGDCLKWGREVHSEVGRDLDLFVQNTLIDMYSKCSSMVDAFSVFSSIQKPNVVSWNALILGYVENGEGILALELFSKLQSARGCVPDSTTFVAALKACTYLGENADGRRKEEWLEQGRNIHSKIGFHLNLYVQNTLVDMYAKCGSMVDARNVFRSIEKPDVVSWTALLLGYAENGDALSTLELFLRMKACGCVPDSVTYIAALKACTFLADGGKQSEALKRGKEIHSEIGCNLDIFLQNTLIDMYAKCGSMVDARNVFDSIPKPNVVSWTALLLGYAENGNGFTTLKLFSRMKASGCLPDAVTYIAALKACILTGSLALGRQLHAGIREFTFHVVTCLVDFYAKCGSMIEACEVFDLHSTARAVSTWNALLAGHSSFGNTGSVFNLFEAMNDQGFQPNDVTILCMLSCCSHAGLVEKAWEYFEAMPLLYGVTPTVMHYTCMIDVLGRANQLSEAISVLQKMPCHPNAVTWMTLLSACCKWKNVEIGRCAFQSLVDMDKTNASACVLMAHIYGSRGMWEEQQKVAETRIKLGACNLPGQTYVIDGEGNTVLFVDGSCEDHPEVTDKLEQFLKSMKVLGSYTIADGEKEEALCGHSERRAVVYGILRVPSGEPVRTFKDMRMCDECHVSTKMISMLSGRTIMVRDSSRFHVMVNGSCSCGDYW